MNLSHIVHEFSFGPFFPAISQPLDLSLETTDKREPHRLAFFFFEIADPLQPSRFSSTSCALCPRLTLMPAGDASRLLNMPSPIIPGHSSMVGGSPASSSSTTWKPSHSLFENGRHPYTSSLSVSSASSVRTPEHPAP